MIYCGNQSFVPMTGRWRIKSLRSLTGPELLKSISKKSGRSPCRICGLKRYGKNILKIITLKVDKVDQIITFKPEFTEKPDYTLYVLSLIHISEPKRPY